MECFKVIIAGGRDFGDYEALKSACDFMLQNRSDIEIVSGTAGGADRLGERFARERGFLLKEFPAEWVKYGKGAGYKRNAQMADYADALIAFWDQKSRGTRSMIELARNKGLKVKVINY